MQMPARTVRPVLGLSALGLLTAIGSAVVGFVLAEVYVPHVAAGTYGGLPELRGSTGWTTAHVVLSVVLLAASVGLTVALAWSARRGRLSARRAAVLLVASGVAVLAAVVTLVSRPLVEWDLLAMWAVTADVDGSGYWTAAFDDGVRFLFIDGREVSQGDYAPVLLVHLGAPVIGAVALLGTTLNLLQSSTAPSPNLSQ